MYTTTCMPLHVYMYTISHQKHKPHNIMYLIVYSLLMGERIPVMVSAQTEYIEKGSRQRD